MKRTYLLLQLGVYLCCCALSGYAQDIHYSQFYNSPMNVNPALTGIFNGDQRVNISFRNQWHNVPVDYLTFSGAYDQKLYLKRSEKGFFGVGGNINYDRAGYSKLSLFQVALNGSYSQQLLKNFFGTLGLNAGYGSRSFSPDRLKWDNQWDGTKYNEALPTGEGSTPDTKGYLDLGAGANFRLQKSERTKVDFGAGFYHLNKPSNSFKGSSDLKLPIRQSYYVEGAVAVANAVDFVLNASWYQQAEYDEKNVGVAAKIYLNQKRGKEFALQVGSQYRFNENFKKDAIMPTLAFFVNSWHVGLSYDINLSEFNAATKYYGGPEVHVTYIIKKVKALEAKNCPIY
ncbi:MAG: PorP/SprF family type IX secretion system membrane protein [Saprospiraceae bacterium]